MFGFNPTQSTKLDAFMAIAAKANTEPKHARVSNKTTKDVKSAKQAITKPAPKQSVTTTNKTYTSSDRGLEFHHKEPSEKPSRLETSVKSIAELETNLAQYQEDSRDLKSQIAIMTKANQALRRAFSGKAAALDVSGELKAFKISSDMPVRTACSKFAKFASQFGLVSLNQDAQGYDTLDPRDFTEILAGIKSARYLEKKYEISSFVEAAKLDAGLDSDISELTAKIAILHKSMDTGRTLQYRIKPEAEIDALQTAKKRSEITTKSLESDITMLTNKIKLFGDMKSWSSVDAKKAISDISAKLDALKSEHAELAKNMAESRRRGTAPGVRIEKILALQKDSFERKRAEVLLKFQSKFSRYGKKQADEMLNAAMRAWEKNEIANQKFHNKKTGLDDAKKNAGQAFKSYDDANKKLAELTGKITELDTQLSYLRSASKFTAGERGQEKDRLQAILNQKKAELRNAARNVKTQETKLASQLDPKLWESRIEDKLSDDKFAVIAKRYMPLHSILANLYDGSSKRTREAIGISYRYARTSLKGNKIGVKPIRGTKMKLTVGPKHFGPQGFVVDPRFMGMNSQLVMVVNAALVKAMAETTDAQIVELLTAAVLDKLSNNADALAAHKKLYMAELNRAAKAILSPKLRTIIYEVTEEMIASGQIQTPDGTKPNKKYIDNVVESLLDIIKLAKPFGKLGSFTWASYRENVGSWLNNALKLDKKRKV